jgi:serine O-acetyltransferase
MNCSIGKNVVFGHFGLGVAINSGTIIKDNVIIYHGVTIGRSRGIIDTTFDSFESIVIGENTLIGAHAIVLAKTPKLTIGANCEIGAGAVVLEDIPANSIAVGNPARVLARPNGSCE